MDLLMRKTSYVTRIANETYNTLKQQDNTRQRTAYFGLSWDTSSLRTLCLSIVRSLLETWKERRSLDLRGLQFLVHPTPELGLLAGLCFMTRWTKLEQAVTLTSCELLMLSPESVFALD